MLNDSLSAHTLEGLVWTSAFDADILEELTRLLFSLFVVGRNPPSGLEDLRCKRLVRGLDNRVLLVLLPACLDVSGRTNDIG
jgi:hypothetical protein